MKISAADVKALRELTNAGMMDCKRALDEAGNDIKKAMDVLRKSGIAKAQKKAGRSASDGTIFPYIHPGSKLGVLLEINCETDFVAKTDDFQVLAKDVAMHIAATSPISVKREDLDKEIVETEKRIFREQSKKSGKPDEIIEKMIDGRMNKFFQENILIEQSFVKNPDISISDLLTETIAKLGENISISRFTRFQLGETAPQSESVDS